MRGRRVSSRLTEKVETNGLPFSKMLERFVRLLACVELHTLMFEIRILIDVAFQIICKLSWITEIAGIHIKGEKQLEISCISVVE